MWYRLADNSDGSHFYVNESGQELYETGSAPTYHIILTNQGGQSLHGGPYATVADVNAAMDQIAAVAGVIDPAVF